MSNLNREAFSDALTTAMRFVFRQWAKHELHTAAPGVVESYDANTRRARIVPGLRMVRTGEAPGTEGEAVDKAVAVNVPVLWPGGSGGLIVFPLAEGDSGLILFSERGITEFKRTEALSVPDAGRFFDESDAMFLPCGFGATQTTPAAEGATFQTPDARTHIEVHADRVQIRRGVQYVTLTDDALRADVTGDIDLTCTGTMRLKANRIIIEAETEVVGDTTVAGDLHANGGEFEHNGRNVGASHTHLAVSPGTGTSGPPS